MMNATAYKRNVLAVDSRSRENADITTPAKYKINFPPIRNVKMIRLISTEVPNTEYVIGARNNLLFLWDGTTEHTVTLTNGTYTATEIANEISQDLNAALNAQFGQIFQVTAMTMTSKIRIDRVDAATNTFQLRFAGRDGTAALALGFDPTLDSQVLVDPVSGNSYTQSVNVMNLAGENFIFMCVKGLSTLTSTEHVNDVFAKIIYNTPPRSIAFDSFISNAFIFPEPQSMITNFEVSFVRRDGYLVDFNTIEHSFTLEFFSL